MLSFPVGTESERTDTEELVGRAASQCSAPPDLLPSEARALLAPSTPPPRPARPHEKTYKPPSPPTPEHDDKPRLRFEVSRDDWHRKEETNPWLIQAVADDGMSDFTTVNHCFLVTV